MIFNDGEGFGPYKSRPQKSPLAGAVLYTVR